MKELSVLIKPASSLCNMRCQYCFYADVAHNREMASYGVMTRETAERILVQIASDLTSGDSLTIAFQGGEPTAAGIDFFRFFFDAAEKNLNGIRISYGFQTNGFTLNEEWCELLKKKEVLVGISIDGFVENHDSVRVDASGNGTYKRVRHSMELLRKYDIPFNVLTVLTPKLAAQPSSVWTWILKEQIDYVQFIPCLAELEGDGSSPFALTPSDFRQFYLQLFPMWKKRMKRGKPVNIKFFDDLVNLYLSGWATSCGITGKCAVQYIVEANGDVFPCDFYVLDKYRMGSLLTAKPSELFEAAAPFLTDGREYAGQEPCLGCRYRNSCGGGCKRLNSSMYIKNGICEYALLLDELLPPLLSFAREYIQRNPYA